MTTLALDLGTRTGYAIGGSDKGSLFDAGTLVLASADVLAEQRKVGGERTHDIRYAALLKFVTEAVNERYVDRIVFEDVLFLSSVDQTQLWASLRGAVWSVNVNNPSVEVQCVPVATLKKFATGNGAADKELMAEALLTRSLFKNDAGKTSVFRSGKKLDDNAIDAIWLLYYAQEMDRTGASWGSIWNSRMERKQKEREKNKRKKEKLKNRQVLSR